MATDQLDENELLDQLTAEEIEELNQCFDPENKYLPARERVEDQTTKAPTGPYDRQKLLDHMREEALNSEVGNDWVPFEKKTRGKVYKPKPKKDETSAKSILPDELTDVLENASEEELMELAAVLGVHSMLSQRQSHEAESDKMWQSLKGSGLRKYKPGIVKSTKYKQYTDPNAVNELDLEKAMERLQIADETLTELNLNNHKEVTPETISMVASELRKNTCLKTLYMANCKISDTLAKGSEEEGGTVSMLRLRRSNKFQSCVQILMTPFIDNVLEIAQALLVNTTLESLNLESNFITRDGIKEFLDVLEKNSTLKEFKLANQAQTAGHQLEMAIAKTLEKNQSLIRFGYSFESRGPRHLANKYILRNNDADRKARAEEKRKEDMDRYNDEDDE